MKRSRAGSVMKKVSIGSVLRKTFLLLRARWRIFLGYLAVVVAVNFVSMFFGVDRGKEAELTVIAVIVGLASFVVLTAQALSLQHFSIASCRNRTSFFPPRPGRVLGRYLLAWISLTAISLIFMAILGTPCYALLASGVLDDTAKALWAAPLFMALVFLALCGGLIPMLRFGAVIPAITIGDPYDYARAWRMTKGHTLRLFALMVIFSLPPMLFVFLWGAWGGPLDADQTTVFMVCYNLLSSVITISCTVCLSIMYDDLNRRYEAMQSAPAPDAG